MVLVPVSSWWNQILKRYRTCSDTKSSRDTPVSPLLFEPRSGGRLKSTIESVDGSKMQDGSVGHADLAGDSVDSSKIEDGSVTGGDLEDETVANADVANGAVGGRKLSGLKIIAVDCHGSCHDTLMNEVWGPGYRPISVSCSNVNNWPEFLTYDCTGREDGDNECIDLTFELETLGAFCDGVAGWDALVSCLEIG